jgi:endonuclease/exonuclease/phosphatase family metal-dependent hydrolase
LDGFLCPDAAAPEEAADVQFIDCAIEGENDRDPAPADDLLVMAWNIERGQQLDAQLAAFWSGALPMPDIESDVSVLDVQVAQGVETAEHAAARPFGVVVGGDTNAPFCAFDVHNGDHNDETIGAFLDRGFADAHAGLHASDRSTRSGLPLDLLLTRDVDARDPVVCEGDVCDGLSDHRAIWATVSLRGRRRPRAGW